VLTTANIPAGIPNASASVPMATTVKPGERLSERALNFKSKIQFSITRRMAAPCDAGRGVMGWLTQVGRQRSAIAEAIRLAIEARAMRAPAIRPSARAAW